MAIRVRERHRDQAGTVYQPVLTTVGRGPKRRAALGSTESALSRHIEPMPAGVTLGQSEKAGFRGPVRNGQDLERELIKGHGRPLSTLLGHSASHSERLFLPHFGPS
jgi:hypothetical protein